MGSFRPLGCSVVLSVGGQVGEFQAAGLVNGAVSGTKRAGGKFQAAGLVNGAVSGTNLAGQ